MAVWKFEESLVEVPEPQSSLFPQSSAPGMAGPMFAADSAVPKFIGLSRENVENTALYAEKYNFIFHEEENDDYAEGIIFNQSPEPGAPMQNKGTVTLYVSKGSVLVPMPALTGQNGGRGDSDP